MDLWVRSQDRRRLIKVDLLSIKDFYNIVSDDFYVLGTYKTEERALEVLDEIQNILKPKGFISFKETPTPERVEEAKKEFDTNLVVTGAKVDLVKVPETFVYNMPKE